MKYTKEKLEPIVLKSRAISEVLRNLGLKQSGGNHYHISNKIKKFEINTSHFLGQAWNRGKKSINKYTKKEFIEKILILNGSGWHSHTIKLKLFEFNIKERKCEKCRQTEIWFNTKLSLHLDHINGNHNDNRLENLKILCPNCHSQTSTYCGKRNKKFKKIIIKKQNLINHCTCGKLIKNKSKYCLKCHHKQLRKVERPSIEQLQNEIKELGYCATGRKYCVSDNAIRKWLK